ncbi:MAG: hypothetical protein DHS20C15_26770 [Planctomycetota bacterium]|nr:MAG: hypothetical protein DHS20C15_26770 [Planctomycetota bacterium]
MRSLARSFSLFFAISLLATAAFGQNADRKGSPFDGLRWNGDAPEVLVESEWYTPRSIHRVPVSEILEFCDQRWPGQRQKRFTEDLVEALQLMGHALPTHVDLDVTKLSDGTQLTLEQIEVTRDKRQALRRANTRAAPRASQPAMLTRADALADLDEFSRRLQDQFAYLELGDFDWQTELDTLRSALPAQVPTPWLADNLARFVAQFRDGHASTSSELRSRPALFPPFLLQDADGGVVAFLPDRSGFLDAEHPFVLEIDGVAIDEWIARASELVARGSPQLVRWRALGGLRALELLRAPEDNAKAGSVRVTLAGADGATPVEREFAMTASRPMFGTWPAHDTALLDGNVGYLRLPAMDDRLLPHLHESMAAFRETDGLIVDVRGNGGGTRTLLLALGGYLTGPDEGPWVGNVAKYILSKRFDRDHLEARFMARATDARWNDAQAAVVAAMAESFEPEWDAPGAFSEWHYLVVDPLGHDADFFYDKPVIVLSDAGCFSATDIFLGALSGRPRVTLMGSASSGGSARSQSFALPHSRIEVRCASMASFRTDGRLYDGRGIEVDVQVEIQATDLLRGGTDSVLAAALERLRASAR